LVGRRGEARRCNYAFWGFEKRQQIGKKGGKLLGLAHIDRSLWTKASAAEGGNQTRVIDNARKGSKRQQKGGGWGDHRMGEGKRRTKATVPENESK